MDDTSTSITLLGEEPVFEGAHIEFVKDDSGKISHMLIQAVEGEFKAPRK
jgi:hypothetical protein